MVDEEEQHPGSWSAGAHGTYPGLFTEDMDRHVRGGLVTDMPAAGRPVYHPPPIRGLPATVTDTDEDHQPGGGTWRPV